MSRYSRWNRARLTTRLLAAVAVLVFSVTALAQVNNYVAGPQDVLAITVYGQAALSGNYTVEADGTFSFPLVGRIKVGGLTLRAIEQLLRKELSSGFLRNPQVSVAVEQHRSQRIFIVGEVRTPGTYALSGDMALIEALARAGSTTEHAGSEALILRPPARRMIDGPIFPDQEKGAEVIRIDIKELQSGRLSQNVQLQDNDTIFIPRAELMYVFGQVKSPGAYPLQKGTTVLQALALAGGLTDRGSSARIKIARLEQGKRVEVRAELEDLVRAGDSIIVPERFF